MSQGQNFSFNYQPYLFSGWYNFSNLLSRHNGPSRWKKKKKRHLQTSGGRGYRDGHFIRQRTRNWMKSLIFAPASPCRYEAGMARGCKAVQRTSSNFFGELWNKLRLSHFPHKTLSCQDCPHWQLPVLPARQLH